MSHLISAWKVTLPEETKQSVLTAIDRQCLSMGPYVEELELKLAKNLGHKYVICMSNGSVCQLALFMAFLSSEQAQPAFIPNRTWVCTPNALEMLRQPYMLFDCEASRPVLHIDKRFLDAIHEFHPSIIVVSYINGMFPNSMDELFTTASTYGIPVIIDRCQSLTNYNYKNESASFYSMGITKLLGIGQGGFIGTDDKDLAIKLRRIRTHGAFDPYWRTPIQNVGFNFRLTDLHAAIGLSILPSLEERINRILSIQQIYLDRLRSLHPLLLPVCTTDKRSPSIYNEYLARNRDELIAFLNENDIQARPLFPSLHQMTQVYPSMTAISSQFNSNEFDHKGISLPSGPDQTHDDISIVCDRVHEFYSRH